MTDWQGTANDACTAGYLAHRYDTNPDQLVIVTAGHCVELGDQDDPWRHGQVHIGKIAKKGTTPVETFFQNSTADVGLIKTNLLSADNRRVRDRLLENTSGNRLRISGYTIWAFQGEGTPVCRMGWNTGKLCRVIEIRDDDKISATPGPDYMILGVVVYSIDALGGDSGGPVFHVTQACETCETVAQIYGTHVHSEEGSWSSTKNGWYSPWDRGVSAMEAHFPGLDLAPCTTSTCGLPDPVGDQ